MAISSNKETLALFGGLAVSEILARLAGWVGIPDLNANGRPDWHTGNNYVMTVFSAGPNGNKVGTQIWGSGHADGLADGDNFVGYRLNRMGNRGD